MAGAAHRRECRARRLGRGRQAIAGLLITTEAMVAEKPKKETPAPAMPGGGMD
jgi:hypothetical protein